MTENPTPLEAYYAVNNHFPDGMPNPKDSSVRKPVEVSDLPSLFKHGRYLSYATEAGKRWRGSTSIPGDEASKYNVNPPEPSDEELVRRGRIAWHPRADFIKDKEVPDFIQKKEKCDCKSREDVAKELKSSGIFF